ncbi:MAG: transporter substrate-binding domain-containing protein [Spirochaetaceae bacterium]
MNIRKLFLFSTVVLFMFNFFSCTKKPLNVVEEEKPLLEITKEITFPIFTPEEETYIKNLKMKDYLSVASYISPGSFEVDSDGRFSGFQYDLTMEFADFLDVKVEIQTILFSDIFSIDGIIPDDLKTDPSYTYVPDIFKTTDLCTGFLTILPWRLQIMEMISYLPVRQMLISRGDNPIRQFSDLKGKTIGYGSGTSYEDTMIKLNEKQNNSFSLESFAFEENLLHEVSEGNIDGTVIDLQYLLLSLKNYPNLVAELPAADSEYVSWGVQKGNTLLAGLVQKFLKYAHETGIIERLFRKQYTVGLEDYYSLIEFDGVELHDLDLTASETLWLDEKRKTGKLTIATVNSKETYMVKEDGTVIGFDYNLINNLTQILGLQLDINLQEDITGFFAKDGIFDIDVTTDPSIIYTPDLLNEVDIYVGPFSIVPWREKLMTMVPMMPMGQVLAGRVGEEIFDITELDGKRLAVLAGSYQETLILGLMDEKDFTVEFSYMDSTDDPLEFVKAGKADYLLDGAVYVAKGMNSLEEIVVSPVKIDLVTIGWAVRKDNWRLVTILEKYINKSLGNGSFGRLWKENNGVDFEYYLNLIKENR